MIRGLLVAGALVAISIVGLWLLQRRLIYFPTAGVGQPPAGWSTATASTDDGIEVGIWYREATGGGPVVVVFNGNAGNRRDRLALGRALADAGFGVVLFDYRGYGGNDGSPSETGLSLDAGAVAAWTRVEYRGARLVFLGESLGAGVAVGEAVERPPDGLVLRSPFTSLSDAASANYFGIPTGWLLWDSYPTVERIGALERPVTVVAGTADSIVPIAQSYRVFDRAADPFEWVPIEGADHNDPELTSGPELVAAVRRLADRLGD